MDQRLHWDPQDFGGIKMTHIPSDELWRPDILLYNKYVIITDLKSLFFISSK